VILHDFRGFLRRLARRHDVFDDDDALTVAVGHLPDTPLHWQPGNSALAGHLDTFFRSLRGIRLGYEIRLSTLHGELRYRVERTVVVEPDDLSVLATSPTPQLTLITCFPFSYVGNAPHRFIVQAQQVGAAPIHEVSVVEPDPRVNPSFTMRNVTDSRSGNVRAAGAS